MRRTQAPLNPKNPFKCFPPSPGTCLCVPVPHPTCPCSPLSTLRVPVPHPQPYVPPLVGTPWGTCSPHVRVPPCQWMPGNGTRRAHRVTCVSPTQGGLPRFVGGFAGGGPWQRTERVSCFGGARPSAQNGGASVLRDSSGATIHRVTVIGPRNRPHSEFSSLYWARSSHLYWARAPLLPREQPTVKKKGCPKHEEGGEGERGRETRERAPWD